MRPSPASPSGPERFRVGDIVTLIRRPDRDGTVVARPGEPPGVVLVQGRSSWGGSLPVVPEREDDLFLVAPRKEPSD